MDDKNHFIILDGVRGLAAVCVVVSHIFMLFYPELHHGATVDQASTFALAVFNSPFSFFYRGGSAVLLFFLLSGYVLTLSCRRKAPQDANYLAAATVRRYFRLGIPVASAIGLAYLGLKAHLFPDAPGGISIFLDFPDTSLGVRHMLRAASYRSMLFGDRHFDYVLWTISIEFYGSLLIFAAYALFGRHIRFSRWLCGGAGALLLLQPRPFHWYGLFLIGAALAQRDTQDEPNVGLRHGTKRRLCVDWRPSAPLRRAMRWATGILGLYLLGFHQDSQAYVHVLNTIKTLQTIAPQSEPGILAPAAGAVCLVWALVTRPRPTRTPTPVAAMTTRFMKRIGQLSFSIYLLHPLALAALGNEIYLHLGKTPLSLILCAALVFPCTYSMAHVFHRYIDQPATRFARRFGDRLFPASPGPVNRGAQSTGWIYR